MARVLVVDDDADVRDLVVGWLRVDGHDVVDVGSGALALGSVEDGGLPQLVVFDVLMPGMDGISMLGHLRQRDGDLPAIALTVLWSSADIARVRDAGAVYLPKPSNGGELRSVVRRLLSAGTAEPGGRR
ncbi:response regulator transcription factor [Actinokineospora diospyrosa]|uniref:Response regulator receiver domain-containing protein n=1 Tax=Actinokineospora diospyrosa TaxID=103728 RepID=A0ABT1IN87_9PSEU|nr:response regulator [Actinokineospora diospyrosa]MCP2274135.1 Response regulator receiver domain-containing protein [Actinokineospora diospyrosa]